MPCMKANKHGLGSNYTKTLSIIECKLLSVGRNMEMQQTVAIILDQIEIDRYQIQIQNYIVQTINYIWLLCFEQVSNKLFRPTKQRNFRREDF